MNISLTVREIMDLAKYSGIDLDENNASDIDEMETIVCLCSCHPDGVKNEDGSIEHFNFVIYFEDYPEEGVIPLGNPIK